MICSAALAWQPRDASCVPARKVGPIATCRLQGAESGCAIAAARRRLDNDRPPLAGIHPSAEEKKYAAPLLAGAASR